MNQLGTEIPKTTLLFLYKPKEGQILLAMKKRRFGEGKYNGIGGKLEAGESIKQSLMRETFEEINVKIKEEDLVQVATLNFSFQNKPEWNQQTHAFFIEKWVGEPSETEEMSPKWYGIYELPFHKMWVDDPHWLPLAIKGNKLNASFYFNETGSEILDMKVEKL